MKIINTKFHGVLDYLTGILLIAAPWIFNFADGTAAQTVPVVLGITTLIMALLTDYELGLIRKIPMSVHLTIDFLMGVFLAASPWLLDFSERVYLPHLIVGIFAVCVSLVTERVPYHLRRPGMGSRTHAH